ncbi:MAG: hypothetical protein AB8B55_11370 [Mariniblastus sp.]
MAIKVRCTNCKAGFQAKDELAGRRVKCPKCKTPLTIAPAQKAPVAAASAAAAEYDPLLDLLNEQDIRSVARGPVCVACNCELQPGAIVCIECGYNNETGEQLETDSYEDDAGVADVGMSDADRIMAKAEKDIDDMPVTSDGQNFGDGADSFVIAIVAAVIGIILIGIGLVIIFMMETVGEYIASSAISFVASAALYVAMGVWITIVGFLQKPTQGIICICTGFLWCIVFGFMQGKQLIIPVIVLIACLVIGGASGAYTFYNGWTPKSDDAKLQIYQNNQAPIVMLESDLFELPRAVRV